MPMDFRDGPLFEIRRPADAPGRLALVALGAVVIIAALLRFWGLGSIGLHGDEDVMALATRGILEHGAPIIPSGMYYPRALPQLYLMAGSVAVFGDSEWSLRLPSALIGTLMVLVGYWLARRFLTVPWSLAFAATLALLPSLISMSQTARMYVFFVAFLMVFAVALFRWERTGAAIDWAMAIAACLAALTLHTLAVFGTLLFFYPGLVKGSLRLFVLGAVAFVACLASFKVIGDWSSAQYFPLVSPVPAEAAAAGDAVLQRDVTLFAAAVAAAAVAVATAGAWLIARRGRWGTVRSLWFVSGSALLAAALMLALLVQYHLAALAGFFGTVFFVRSGGKLFVPFTAGVLIVALFGLHAWQAWSSPEVGTFYHLAEALLGTPKPLAYLTFLQFAPIAVVGYALIVLLLAGRFANGRPFPDHGLFFLISVFAPLFLMAFFADVYVPERYISGVLPFFVLATFAGVHYVLGPLAARFGDTAWTAHAVAALATLAAFIEPRELARNLNVEYADFPYLTEHRGVDHKGAAEYVIARGADEEDLVIVVDSQQHGYYLDERADYYMRSLHGGRNSSIMRDGRMLNLYTGVPQISSGEQLARVVQESSYDEVFVVGSGEIEDNRMRYMANGIWDTMQEFGFERSWLGRDGATPVWRYSRTQARDLETAPQDAAGEHD